METGCFDDATVASTNGSLSPVPSFLNQSAKRGLSHKIFTPLGPARTGPGILETEHPSLEEPAFDEPAANTISNPDLHQMQIPFGTTETVDEDGVEGRFGNGLSSSDPASNSFDMPAAATNKMNNMAKFGLLASPPDSDSPTMRALFLEDNSKPSNTNAKKTNSGERHSGVRSRTSANDGLQVPSISKTGSDENLGGSGRFSRNTPGRPNQTSLFSRAIGIANRVSPFSTIARYPSDHSELDAAIQQDIQEAEAELAREQREEATEARRQRWQQGFAWLRPRSQSVDDDRSDHAHSNSSGESEDDTRINWWQLLNPWTHLKALPWLVGNILNKFTDFVSRLACSTTIRQYLANAFYFFGACVALVMALSFFKVTTSMPPGAISELVSSIDLGNLVRGVKTYIPSISWSSPDLLDQLPNLEDMDGDKRLQLQKLLDHIIRDVGVLKNADKLHDTSLQKLETVIPKVVHMKLMNGKPVVTQEFWHAIRDLVHEDKTLLTFNKKGNNIDASSEQQWESIVTKLAKDPAFTSSISSRVDGMENKLSDKLPSLMDTWVKNNGQKVSKILGSALKDVKLEGSQKTLQKTLEDITKKHANDSGVKDTVLVTREDFLAHMKTEFAAHRAEIKAELLDLHPQLEQLVRDSVKLATKDIPLGMTRDETLKLVKGVVKKAIADVNLEAMAKGKIHAHWDKDLRNQVNYFAPGSGALADPVTSSNTFQPHSEWRILRGKAYRPLPPVAALLPWEDDGDCWCAIRSKSRRGNPHGATLSVIMANHIIPQHLVMEHILLGATTDPGSRPRNIEVYARIENVEVRKRVLDFSAVHFPDDTTDWDFTPAEYAQSYVKISQFVYEGAEIHEGVHIHRFSDELMALNAETDQMIVRAVSNYGADTHTCFYRVRLYGHKVS